MNDGEVEESSGSVLAERRTNVEVSDKATAKAAASFQPEELDELLRLYYQRFFPFQLFYRWLNYGHINDRNFFGLREFCLTLKDDVYLRYQSFDNQAKMEERLRQKDPRVIPFKIDIGPIYSARITDTKLNPSIVPVERELIFDIDMTDYDEVRLCCSGADICGKCWPLMVLAIKIIHRVLTEDFGFQHIFWVFSGRRGVHCWVCDKKARSLKQAARSAIVEYLTMIKGGNVGKARRVQIQDSEHAAVAKALNLVRAYFLRHLVREQKIMESKKGLPKLLSMLEDETLIAKVKKTIDNTHGSEKRWNSLVEEVTQFVQEKKGTPEYRKVRNMLDEMQVQFCYPRLDVNVSHGLNHLLKSPFSIHPKTGRVCVPINPDFADSFNPFDVPTVKQLEHELNVAYDAAKNQMDISTPDDAIENKKVSPEVEAKKTSLKESIILFETFVRRLEASWKRQRDRAEDQKMEF
ncbi:hypothetical protein RvY_03283 [Ramazzottius varieornatus]|uniref:DNA primase n=1 Tax=Ramazzottius varieornatus TaxID=947166 RepID=A0A1D1UT89_RAMVA|nr:hypothetical protein RvY_03283 [Ramazzottius varieornatus]